MHTAKIAADKLEAVYWPLIRHELQNRWEADGVTVVHSDVGPTEIRGEKEKVSVWQEEILNQHEHLVSFFGLSNNEEGADHTIE